MSENALGYLLNRAGFHHYHVPHGFRSTIMNEGFRSDRQVTDVMLAHSLKDKVEGAYNRAIYLERRRELAQVWADLVREGQVSLGELIATRNRSVVWRTGGIDPVLDNAGMPADCAAGQFAWSGERPFTDMPVNGCPAQSGSFSNLP
ncbi:hypothetical protein S101446_00814 [Komagataeibacter europaeus]|nr:hypothetical protein S101446_00814 [Komagataeibacter europaeus]